MVIKEVGSVSSWVGDLWLVQGKKENVKEETWSTLLSEKLQKMGTFLQLGSRPYPKKTIIIRISVLPKTWGFS